jgi:hypothetical protein
MFDPLRLFFHTQVFCFPYVLLYAARAVCKEACRERLERQWFAENAGAWLEHELKDHFVSRDDFSQ